MSGRIRIVHAAVALLLAPSGLSSARAATPIAPPNLPAADAWVPTAGGQIRVLDKQKAEGKVIDLKVGQSATFESLTLTLRACEVRPPSLPADAAGFLEVDDSRPSEPGFHGWMLADEPFVALLESPTYGVRVVGCEKPTEAAIAAVTPAKAAPPPLPQGAGSTSPSGDQDQNTDGADAGQASGEAPAPTAPHAHAGDADGDQQDLSAPPPASASPDSGGQPQD